MITALTLLLLAASPNPQPPVGLGVRAGIISSMPFATLGLRGRFPPAYFGVDVDWHLYKSIDAAISVYPVQRPDINWSVSVGRRVVLGRLGPIFVKTGLDFPIPEVPHMSVFLDVRVPLIRDGLLGSEFSTGVMVHTW